MTFVTKLNLNACKIDIMFVRFKILSERFFIDQLLGASEGFRSGSSSNAVVVPASPVIFVSQDRKNLASSRVASVEVERL